MNSPAIHPAPTRNDSGEDDKQYHHHTRDIMDISDLDGHHTLHAICGVERFPLNNPLAYPCCPKCKRYLKNGCISQNSS